MNAILADIKSSPIIAAIREIDDVDIALSKDIGCIFLLTGSILNIKYVVKHIKKAKKRAFLHIDFIEGIGKDSEGTKFVVEEICPDGIITTRSNLAVCARNLGVFTIQRFFILDSLAVDTAERAIRQTKPDAIEILPGIMPKTIGRMADLVQTPIIAGGLVETKEEMEQSLASGAIAVSTSQKSLWNIPF